MHALNEGIGDVDGPKVNVRLPCDTRMRLSVTRVRPEAAFFQQANAADGGAVINFNLSTPATITLAQGDLELLNTTGGTVIKMPVDGIKRMGRATQGVIVMRLTKGEKVSALAPVVESDENGNGDDDAEPTEQL